MPLSNVIKVMLEHAIYPAGPSLTKKPQSENLDKAVGAKDDLFSKLEAMHDTVIGLLINQVEFGVDIHAKQRI